MKYTATTLVAVMLAAAAPSQAATREDLYQAFQRCNAMSDNRTWLDCIYGAAQPMRAELGLPPAPADQVRLVPPAMGATAPMVAPQKKKTGFLSYVLGGNQEIEAMPLRSYNFDSNGFFTVTFADGQVWRQKDDDRQRAGWKAAAAHYQASIRAGALGSSILTVRGEPGAYMVSKVP